jgi:hypothetical protein
MVNKNCRNPVEIQSIDLTNCKLDSGVLSDFLLTNGLKKALPPPRNDEEADEECPDMFLAGSSYEEGDVVEMDGVVYKCKSWPCAQWCSVTSYEPGSEKSANAWDIIAWAWGSGSSDYVDFYYSQSATNPIWNLIGSMRCTQADGQTKSLSYYLPAGAGMEATTTVMIWSSKLLKVQG